jgi:ABC-type Zn uptake system ZnuABC Zn-binding protein ZnuA
MSLPSYSSPVTRHYLALTYFAIQNKMFRSIKTSLLDLGHSMNRLGIVVLCALSGALVFLNGCGEPATSGHPDPHVWMDVSAWSQCVGFVAEKLKEYDPPNAAYYQSNAEAYQQELKDLHEYVKKVISSIPEPKRMLITSHDAFSYFSRAYGIEVRAPQGVDTRQEASVGDINRLVDLIVEREIEAIFTEDSVNENNLTAIVQGAAQRGWQVRKAEKSLFSDSMGPAGTYEGTYLGMIDHNATTIARELGGSAPEKGLHGKLGEAAKSKENAAAQYTIVTTTAMVGDIVRRVTGDKAKVVILMKEGTDPHVYAPTRDDMNQVRNGDVVFYSGLLLEARMTEVFEQAAAEGKRVYAVTEKLEKSYQLIYP